MEGLPLPIVALALVHWRRYRCDVGYDLFPSVSLRSHRSPVHSVEIAKTYKALCFRAFRSGSSPRNDDPADPANVLTALYIVAISPGLSASAAVRTSMNESETGRAEATR